MIFLSPDTRRNVSHSDIDSSDDLGRPVGKLVCVCESVYSGDEMMVARRIDRRHESKDDMFVIRRTGSTPVKVTVYKRGPVPVTYADHVTPLCRPVPMAARRLWLTQGASRKYLNNLVCITKASEAYLRPVQPPCQKRQWAQRPSSCSPTGN